MDWHVIKTMIVEEMDRLQARADRLEERGKNYHHGDAYTFDPEVREQINTLDGYIERLDRAHDILHGD